MLIFIQKSQVAIERPICADKTGTEALFSFSLIKNFQLVDTNSLIFYEEKNKTNLAKNKNIILKHKILKNIWVRYRIQYPVSIFSSLI